MNINIYAVIALGLVLGCLGIYFIYRSMHSQPTLENSFEARDHKINDSAQEFKELEVSIRRLESVPHVENNKNSIEFQNVLKVANAVRSDIQKLKDLNIPETTQAYNKAALAYVQIFEEILNSSNAYSMLGGELKQPVAQKMQDSYVKLEKVQQDIANIKGFNSELALISWK